MGVVVFEISDEMADWDGDITALGNLFLVQCTLGPKVAASLLLSILNHGTRAVRAEM